MAWGMVWAEERTSFNPVDGKTETWIRMEFPMVERTKTVLTAVREGDEWKPHGEVSTTFGGVL